MLIDTTTWQLSDYCTGWFAHCDAQPASACPHPEGERAEYWLAGYDAADGAGYDDAEGRDASNEQRPTGWPERCPPEAEIRGRAESNRAGTPRADMAITEIEDDPGNRFDDEFVDSKEDAAAKLAACRNGYNAARDRNPISSCPYRVDDPLAHYWLNGWDSWEYVNDQISRAKEEVARNRIKHRRHWATLLIRIWSRNGPEGKSARATMIGDLTCE